MGPRQGKPAPCACHDVPVERQDCFLLHASQVLWEAGLGYPFNAANGTCAEVRDQDLLKEHFNDSTGLPGEFRANSLRV